MKHEEWRGRLMIVGFGSIGRGVLPRILRHLSILEIATPYLGKLVGAFTDCTPLDGRGTLFPEDLDVNDPWQFKNIRVA